MWTQQFTDLQQLWDKRSLVVRGGPQSPVTYFIKHTQKPKKPKTEKRQKMQIQGRLGDIGFLFLIGGLDF
jgi:hypothetical protein